MLKFGEQLLMECSYILLLIFVQKACVQYVLVISPNILLVNLTNKKQQKV
jgi:hypothetical protein